jgi:hypothetical protein
MHNHYYKIFNSRLINTTCFGQVPELTEDKQPIHLITRIKTQST